jgi:hypothetical protein
VPADEGVPGDAAVRALPVVKVAVAVHAVKVAVHAVKVAVAVAGDAAKGVVAAAAAAEAVKGAAAKEAAAKGVVAGRRTASWNQASNGQSMRGRRIRHPGGG